jgi:hypothetical protein
MVLYFPVSALVTLFGNILQNPLDPRAKSDARLMSVVVTFLSMLGPEAETGGVHRMLSVCSEFERIAKVVIDKSEKEHTNRRKRKTQDSASVAKAAASTAAAAAAATASAKPTTNGNTPAPTNNAAQTPRPMTSSSATPQASHGAKDHLSPSMASNQQNGYSPMNSTMSQNSSPDMPPPGWTNDFTVNGGSGMDTGPDFNFADFTGFGAIENMDAAALVGPGGLQSPPLGAGNVMLPNDLYSLPAQFDWSWNEMSGGVYPTIENGNFGQERR